MTPVLDEVEALNDVDVRIAGRFSNRVPDGKNQCGHNRAVAPYPVSPNTADGCDDRRYRQHRDGAADNAHELTGKRRTNPAADKSDERC